MSVGEVQAAMPLVRALLASYPNTPLVLTTMTPTGSQRIRTLFGDAVIHSYVPYDLAFSVQRFCLGQTVFGDHHGNRVVAQSFS